MELISGEKNIIEQAEHSFVMSIVEQLDHKESSAGEHVRRTTAYVKIIIEELLQKGFYKDQIDEDFIVKVLYASPLHDIGKLYTPDEILNKPGKLSKDEFEIMKMHTINGANVIDEVIKKNISDSNLVNLLSCAKEIALYHHERWDGTGYPASLFHDNIPLSARIVSIADVFDALTSKRVYRDALTVDTALRIILDEVGKQFDPRVVSAFLSSFDKIQDVLETIEIEKMNI